MKRLRNISAVLLLVAITGIQTRASVPPMINYQGKLGNASGAPVGDGVYSMQFAIYDVSVGGSALWTETNPNVQVKGGLFSVLLGSVNNIPSTVFSASNRFFGVTVGTDAEMTPRQQIASVGFAANAASADVATTVPDGAITAAKLAPGVATPAGAVIMWSGPANQIPPGWVLCDGTNGTPDLRNKFIVGAGDEYVVAATGGEEFHQLTIAEMPSHNHPINDPGHSHQLGEMGGWGAGSSNNSQWRVDLNSPANAWSTYVETSKTGITVLNAGGDQPFDKRPPYYALCFIMKQPY